MTSVWGVDHGVVSKGLRSDKPKYKGVVVDQGKPIDTVNVVNTGKKSLIRRRPKYQAAAFSSQGGEGYARLQPFKPNKTSRKELGAHLASGKPKSKSASGITYQSPKGKK